MITLSDAFIIGSTSLMQFKMENKIQYAEMPYKKTPFDGIPFTELYWLICNCPFEWCQLQFNTFQMPEDTRWYSIPYRNIIPDISYVIGQFFTLKFQPFLSFSFEYFIIILPLFCFFLILFSESHFICIPSYLQLTLVYCIFNFNDTFISYWGRNRLLFERFYRFFFRFQFSNGRKR